MDMEKIKALVDGYEIVYLSLTGSSIFISQEERKKDIDVLVVCKDYPVNAKKFNYEEDGIRYDVFVKDYLFLKDLLSFKIYAPELQTYNLFYSLGSPIINKENIYFDAQYHERVYTTAIKDRLKGLGFDKDFPVYFTPNYKLIAIPVVFMRYKKNNNYKMTEEIMQEIKSLYNNEVGIEIYFELAEFYELELALDKMVQKNPRGL